LDNAKVKVLFIKSKTLKCQKSCLKVNWGTGELARWRVCWQASLLHKEYFISFAAIKRNKERKITAV
jgi:hypothetical protein